ncbi:MAG: hypothetical protein CMH62_01140 [Nanoarchaeota archaeon]|nr:hypothetical protein [Nanoarchaeota archaeon]|tara:strand:+ start:1987 stop:2244 length:258 start_codon:yes stop_codon:yes gene_type:complete
MQILRPESDSLESYGKISYQESVRAWNTIRIPKVILEKFPQLKRKSSIVLFKLEFCDNYDNTIRRIVELKENKKGVPLLLYLFEE